MKYEAVFGNQRLFDGAPEDAEMAATVCQMPRWYATFDGKVLFCDSKKESWQSADFNYPGSQLLAMRRIIQEPKRWTVEDQEAGLLPEVGAELLHESEGYVNFVGEFDFRWMLRTKEGGLYLAEKFYCSPIETPKEKAERLRNEWCNEAGGVCSLGMTTLTRIYDALLSGDLPAPGKE